jgi:hypothetical protein
MVLCYSAFALVAASPARAHSSGVSQSDFVLEPDGSVSAQLVFAAAEIAGAVALDANHDGTVSAEELSDAQPDVKRMVLDGIEVKADGAACAATFERAELVEADGLVIRARYACAAARTIDVTLYLLSELRPEHRHVLRIVAPGVTGQKLLSGTNRSASLDIGSAPRPKAAAWKRTTAVLVSAVWTVATIAFAIWRWRRTRPRPTSS